MNKREKNSLKKALKEAILIAQGKLKGIKFEDLWQ